MKAIIEEAYDTARTILSEHLDQLTAVAEGLLEVETLDNRQFEELYDGVKTPEEIGQELKEELKKREISNRAEAAEAEKMHKKALEEEKKRQLEEAAKALEEKHGDSKFKPTIMTYNDVTKTATPYEPENRDDDDEPAADPQDRDDDMPSEEELAVYDTDYLNADDEDSSEEEHDAEDHSSDEEK